MQAEASGANLIIAHEGMYYSHRGDVPALEADPVFAAKRAWLERSKHVVYRNHDGLHRHRPDLVTEGLLEALGWQPYVEERLPAASVVRLPAPGLRLREVIMMLKRKLDLPYVRVVGEISARCERVGVAVGYRGGGAVAVPLLGKYNVDVVVAGEGPEWETPEYVRDALQQGRKRAFVLIGHEASEEPGMRRLADRLAAVCPEVPARFVRDRRAIFIF
jgi:putative NIF3 family GTP cyclohydrolase 1 type 2